MGRIQRPHEGMTNEQLNDVMVRAAVIINKTPCLLKRGDALTLWNDANAIMRKRAQTGAAPVLCHGGGS